MKAFWDERYKNEEFAYGTEPNQFFKFQLKKVPEGSKILFPADGEGRNSVYAATQNMNSVAFDISTSGREKALKLAKAYNVNIDYQVGSFDEIKFEDKSFDGIVFSYTHFPKGLKDSFFQTMMSKLKTNGWIIFECFSVKNIPLREQNPKIGGPLEEELLYTIDELEKLIGKEAKIWEELTELNEGLYHVGKGCVIRAIKGLPNDQ